MIARIFIYFYKKISFAFAIAVFTTAWSWVVSTYAFFFVYSAVNYKKEELLFLLVVMISCSGAAIILHVSHFGLWHRLGCSGFTKTLRLINEYFNDKYIFNHHKSIDNKDFLKVYNAVSALPKNNLITAAEYTVLVIITVLIIIFNYNRDIEKALFVIIGGMFAAILNGYFTFLLTEYFIGPYKMRLEQILFERSIKIETRNMLSFKYKSIIMMLLVLLSMIILTILIRLSEKSILEISFFIFLSIVTIGSLMFIMINNLNISLDTINQATKKLASGGNGLFFPPFLDNEFITFSENYNNAAIEINEIRSDLEKKITKRTEELSNAYGNLNRVYSQIQADLNLAKRIQKRIMPENFDQFNGVDLSVHYYPMTDIGGDIYDIIQLRPGCVRIFLADAIGHGIQAALITMIIKSEYEKVKMIEGTRELLEWLNRSFTDLYSTLNAFFSCIVVDIDIRNMKVRFSSAGHPDQIHIHNNSDTILKHTGKLIGIKKDATYDYIEADLNYHDKVLLYTDGLFEQYNDRDEGFNEKNIYDAIEEKKSEHINELCNTIIGNLRKIMGGNEMISIRDDITLIGIEITNI